MSKVESAKTALEQLLEGGELLANGRLPPERDLCAQFSVSRNTLRTALDLLEAQGKIWRRVGSGTYAGNAPPMDHCCHQRDNQPDRAYGTTPYSGAHYNSPCSFARNTDGDRLSSALRKENLWRF
jgi:DNA-binding transcriptional MocR family regulator